MSHASRKRVNVYNFCQYIEPLFHVPKTLYDFISQASYVPFYHVRQTSSAGDIEAMESIRDILDHMHFHRGHCFSYGFKYLNNETNKVCFCLYLSANQMSML